MLGALFGKLIEISGFAKAIAAGISHVAGRRRAMLGIVVICALMVYGGVSVFVVALRGLSVRRRTVSRGRASRSA